MMKRTAMNKFSRITLINEHKNLNNPKKIKNSKIQQYFKVYSIFQRKYLTKKSENKNEAEKCIR